MSRYKYTYLEVREKPWNTGRLVMRYDATGMEPDVQEAAWKQIEAVFPPETHATCTVGSNVELEEFGRN
jgi:hypothetical protein